MERSQHVTAEDLDLAPVFGEIDLTTRERVIDGLRKGDTALREAATDLELETDGLILSTYPSGQTEIAAKMSGADGKLTFEIALRPWSFFSERNPWRPGQPPRPMQTDQWDIEATVNVMVRRKVGTHKYTIQETPESLPEERLVTPREAAGTVASYCEQLAELARSREPTVEAWAAPDPAA